MDIKELNKTQLVLLTLLITFVVSVATGIVTVSLMNQMPKTVPQTINNVIQRTIEKVTTVQAPAPIVKDDEPKKEKNETEISFLGDGDALVFIYPIKQLETENFPENEETIDPTEDTFTSVPDQTEALGQGVIISEVGLILTESNILTSEDNYQIDLGGKMFEATILKKFNNGFTILKILPILEEPIEKTEDSTENN